MAKFALCLSMPGETLDAALQQGLVDGGCELVIADNLGDAISFLLKNHRHADTDGYQNKHTTGTLSALMADNNLPASVVILAASVRAGAIALLALLRDYSMALPWTILYDEECNDVHTAVKALQLGVREYVLASEPEAVRRLNARMLVEHASSLPHNLGSTFVRRQSDSPPDMFIKPKHAPPSAIPARLPPTMEWDSIGRVIHMGDNFVRLSAVENRIFGKLLARRGQTVAASELVSEALMHPDMDIVIGVRRLRPHVMRLRQKLDGLPDRGLRIINMRGSGYKLV